MPYVSRSISFSYQLRKHREARGLTQAELASRSGLQGSAIAHIEGGRRSPGLVNLVALADALEIGLDELVGRTEAPGPGTSKLIDLANRLRTEELELLVDIAQVMTNRRRKNEQAP